MDCQLKTRKESGKALTLQETMPEEFLPYVEWTTNPSTHVLRIHLPGFKMEDLKVDVDSSGKLTVRGKRTTSEIKTVRLDQSFEVPKDSDAAKITGRYEEEYLTVVMPRKAMGWQGSWKNVPLDDKAGVTGRKRRATGAEGLQEVALEHGLVVNLFEKVNRNKNVIAVAVAAFAVGFYVSQRLRSRG